MDTPFFPVKLDHVQVVKELEASEALPTDHAAFTHKHIGNNKESHTWAGLFEFQRSLTLMAWIADRSIPVDRAVVFVSRSGIKSVWHRDGPTSIVAINLPWFGDGLTATEWMVNPTSPEQELTVYNPDNSIRRIELIDSSVPATHHLLMNSPHLVNISKHHRIDSTQSQTIRGIISLRFKPKITFNHLQNWLL